MNLKLQIIFCVLALAITIGVIRLVRNGDLELRYSLIWIAGGSFVMFFAFFPGLGEAFLLLLGFKLASNAIFSCAILLLTLINLFQMTALNRAKHDIRRLAQTVALKESELTETQAGAQAQ